MTLLIRDCEPADLDALRDVYRRSSLSNDGDRAGLLANPGALEFPGPATGGGRTRVAVATGGRVVGFATTLIAGDAAELDDLFVDPGWMRRGIGRALVLDAIEIARGRGASRVEVTANPHALVSTPGPASPSTTRCGPGSARDRGCTSTWRPEARIYRVALRRMSRDGGQRDRPGG